MKILGILLLFLGLFLRYAIGRRRFNRRSIAGVQGFKSYSYAIITLIIEKLVNALALLFILLAIILLIMK